MTLTGTTNVEKNPCHDRYYPAIVRNGLMDYVERGKKILLF